MQFERLFSDEQLVEIAKSPAELAGHALAENNLPRVKELLAEMTTGHKPLHVLGLHTLTRMWGKYRTTFGEDRAKSMLDAAADNLIQSWADLWKSGRERETIADLASIYRNQASAKLAAAETTHQVIVDLIPCGSGGMLMKQKWHEREPQFYEPFSDGIPVTCHGCKSLQAAFNNRCGREIWNTDISNDGSGSCRMTFEKSAADIGKLFDDPKELCLTRPAQSLEYLAQGGMNIEEFIRDQHHEWKPWHDFMLCWIEYTFAAFHEMGGYDLLKEALLECYETVFYPRYAVFEQWSDTERLQRSAWSWHYHMARFRIIEEQHRFAFILDPCGSGARLFRGDVMKPPFRYGNKGAPLTMVPHEISFGRKDFPIYCSHCATTNATQFDGLPLIFVVDGHAQMRPGMPCRQYIYKKGAPREVERRLLVQVGRQTVAPARPLNGMIGSEK